MTRESRGFGFVDFDSVESAKTFMESTTGKTFVSNVMVTLEYSHKALQHKDKAQPFKDWICESCSSHNFANRDKCFACAQQRTLASQEVLVKPGTSGSGGAGSESHEHAQETPTVELIIRGLSLATTEEMVSVI